MPVFNKIISSFQTGIVITMCRKKGLKLTFFSEYIETPELRRLCTDIFIFATCVCSFQPESWLKNALLVNVKYSTCIFLYYIIVKYKEIIFFKRYSYLNISVDFSVWKICNDLYI